LRIVSSLDEKQWRHFVDHQPTATIFHTPEMFQVFARAKGYRPAVWAALGDDEQVLALLLPVQITLGDGLLRYLTTRAVVFGSVLYDARPAGEEALHHLLHRYVQEVDRHVLFTELRNLSDLSQTQPILNAFGFAYEDHLNFLIDLDRPLEEVLAQMGRRTRKQIRRGLRQGAVEVDEITDRSQVATCYALLKKSYVAARVPLADRSLFEAAFDVLHPRGMVKFWLARIGMTNVAASVELLYHDVMYGWYGGGDRSYTKYTPGELLMWHILQWGVANNYRVYDFGGAGKPDEDYGVRDFKAKFGGALVRFGRNTRVHAPGLLRLSSVGYWFYRHLYHRF
jgi:hypothetical protein